MKDELQNTENNQETASNPTGEQEKEGTDLVFSKNQQAEIDRQITAAVANALSRRDKMHEKSQEEAIKAALEAERKKAAMTAAERLTAEQEERQKTLDEREKALNQREFKGAIMEKLAKTGLPLELVDILSTSCDADNVDDTITNLKSMVDSAVNTAIKEKSTQREPRASQSVTDNNISSFADDIVSFSLKNRKVK